MSLPKALLMVVILLALGAYLYFVEFPQQEEEASKKKLFTFDKDAVTEVTLTYPDRVLQLKKGDDGKWRITQPVAVEADTTTVTNLVGAIADAEVTRILEDASQDLSLYGLTAPLVKVHVTLKDGKTLPPTSIGKDTPVGYSVYVQKEGEAKLFLTPQAFRLGMTKEVKELRDKTIIAFPSEEVKKVEIQRPENTIVLAKADGGWNLEKPVSGKADDTQVQTFLSHVQGLRAQDFIDQPVLELKEYGLVPPQLKVSLTVGPDSAQQTVLLGGEKTEEKGGTQRYVKRGETDTLFLVGDWVYHDLNKTVNDFRDKTVAHFAPDQVAKVEVSRQDGAGFTLTRGADKKWSMDKTQEGTLKEASLSQLVTDLHELRGFEVVADNPQDLGPFGLKQPTVTLALYDEKGTKLTTVVTGQKAEGETKKSFAMTEGGSTVFALRDYIFDRLNKTPADFWEKPAEKKAEGTPPASSTTESEAESEEEETE